MILCSASRITQVTPITKKTSEWGFMTYNWSIKLNGKLTIYNTDVTTHNKPFIMGERCHVYIMDYLGRILVNLNMFSIKVPFIECL